jgi:hypothetical protein
VRLWQSHNQGETQNTNSEIKECKFCLDSEFDHSLGLFLFAKWNFMVNIVSFAEVLFFRDPSYEYSQEYHGTSSENRHSILQHGLEPSGTTVGESQILMRCGQYLGEGGCASKCSMIRSC